MVRVTGRGRFAVHGIQGLQDTIFLLFVLHAMLGLPLGGLRRARVTLSHVLDKSTIEEPDEEGEGTGRVWDRFS